MHYREHAHPPPPQCHHRLFSGRLAFPFGLMLGAAVAAFAASFRGVVPFLLAVVVALVLSLYSSLHALAVRTRWAIRRMVRTRRDP